MHSVFSLTLTFVNTSVLLLLLGRSAEFLAFLFLIVYVGAIAILFLFVVMMLNIRIVELIENTTRYTPIGLIVGVVFYFELSPKALSVSRYATGIFDANLADKVSPSGDLYTADPYSGHHNPKYTGFSHNVFLKDENTQDMDSSRFFGETIDTIKSLGSVLYTEYFIYFLISSIILLVAMVGAIVLTLYHEKGVKRQDIFSQIAATQETLRLRS